MKTGTSISRVLSSSAAAWAGIVINITTQLMLVPIYLSSWGPDVYGAWLLSQAAWGFINTIDAAHNDYVGYECLRLGSENRASIARAVVSSMPIALAMAIISVLIAWGLGHSTIISDGADIHDALYDQWRASLLLQSFAWLTTGSATALAVRAITPFGHFPMAAWWMSGYAFATAVAPAVAVVMGANLWGASIAFCATGTIYQLVFLARLNPILRAEGVLQGRPILELGLKQMFKSLWLVAKGPCEMLRRQGIRMVLAPLSGVDQMAAFSTMRTGANVALQGLNTIANPVLPELMRFVNARDQPRMESTFAVVWLVLCAALSPGVLVIQSVAPIVFPIWTHGKLAFDPMLFAMLSLVVLVYTLSVPAIAILQGNNLLRAQLMISLLAATTTVVGMILLVPLTGIRGAGLALLIAEAASLLAGLRVALVWLHRNGMAWPTAAFGAAAASTVFAGGGMAAMALIPGSTVAILMLSLITEALVLIVYWRRLPSIARARATGLASRFLPASWRRRAAAL